MKQAETYTGLLVARKPEYDSDPNLGPGYPTPPLNGRLYSGVKRLIWDPFNVDGLMNRLPEDLRSLFLKIKSFMHDDTCIDAMTDSLDDAKLILEYCNRQGDINEIIAFRSAFLYRMKNTKVTIPSDRVIMLGYDVLQGWSLLRYGVFFRPQHFLGWPERLNPYGLLDDPKLETDYVKDYVAASLSDFVDPVIENSPVECVEVAQIIV